MAQPLWYKRAAGVPHNAATFSQLTPGQYEQNLAASTTIPQFSLAQGSSPAFPEHPGWNPVYWSDYPKQPAWTVPMPRIAGPIPVVAERSYLRSSHRAPTEYLSPHSGGTWIPDLPPYDPSWNPYVSETNRAFQRFEGPLAF